MNKWVEQHIFNILDFKQWSTNLAWSIFALISFREIFSLDYSEEVSDK